MRKPESDRKNQQRCKHCGRIVGCDYRGRKHKCDCNRKDKEMLKLNKNEKIDSWDVVVKTTDSSNAHGQGRELSCDGDLGLELPYTAEQQIDECLKEYYPCSWND